MNKPLNFIITGRAGSGKGTQANLLTDYIKNIHHIESGVLFRELAQQETDLGLRIKEIHETGTLAPEVIAIALWVSDLAYKVKRDQGIIFDGSPRRLEEAKHLDEILKFMNRFDNLKVLLVDISNDEARKRLKLRARSDDTEEAIQNRLDFFDENVLPVVEHYEKIGKLIKINGEQSIEKIHEDIRVSLNI